MATNKIGKGTCNIAVNSPVGIRQAIGKLAYESDMSMGEYVRMLCAQAILAGATFKRRKAREIVATAAREASKVIPSIMALASIALLRAPRRRKRTTENNAALLAA